MPIFTTTARGAQISGLRKTKVMIEAALDLGAGLPVTAKKKSAS
jgi:hypothetical protein